MTQENNIKSRFAGLSDKAYSVALSENNRRKSAGLKSSISAIVSEAVISMFDNKKEAIKA